MPNNQRFSLIQDKSNRSPASRAKDNMTAPQDNQQPQTEVKQNDKEHNFRALEAKMLQERSARLEAERRAQEAERILQEQSRRSESRDDEDDESDPYVDHKKLNKKLSKFGQNTQSEIQKAMEQAKIAAKEELKQEMWLDNNPDFYSVLEHAEKFAARSPELAKTILRMPEGFERQKLVYQNIKEMGLHKPEVKQPSIQDKVDANRRSPYYQPSSVGAAPYASTSDYSPSGQKQAYEKMLELKNKLRI